MSVYHPHLQSSVDFGPCDRNGAGSHWTEEGDMTGKRHGTKFDPLDIVQSSDRPFVVGEVKKSSLIQNLQAAEPGFLINRFLDLIPIPTVKNLPGHWHIGDDKGCIQHPNKGIHGSHVAGCSKVDLYNVVFENAHLFTSGTQGARWIHPHLDITPGGGFNHGFEYHRCRVIRRHERVRRIHMSDFDDHCGR